MSTPRVRDARSEADALLKEPYEARVLEPSPPADMSDPAYLAEDPTDRTGAHRVVSPVSDGDVLWADHAAGSAQLAAFARAHWLGPRRRLVRLPAAFVSSRDAAHQLAFFAIAPKRHAEVGKLGLRWTRGGLGTPFHPTDEGDQQVRLDGDALIVQTGHEVDWITPTTVGEACAFLGVEYRPVWFEGFRDPLDPVGPDVELALDAEAVRVLGDWFGFATGVLEELRRTPGAVDVGRVQLWPEHLDPAVELGSQEAGQRASYGASPGDADHDEPYLYVAPWSGPGPSADDPYWNDDTFGGASLPYAQLLDAEHQFATALEFLRRGHELLTR
jgi:hypothetical protein